MDILTMILVVAIWLTISILGAVIWGREQRHRGWKAGYDAGWNDRGEYED